MRQRLRFVVVVVGIAVTGLTVTAFRYEMARAFGQQRAIDVHFLSDTNEENIQNVVVYLSGSIENPLRSLLAVHAVYHRIGEYRLDADGRVRLNVPFYSHYKLEAYLPNKDSIYLQQVYSNLLYHPAVWANGDGKVVATLPLSAARSWPY